MVRKEFSTLGVLGVYTGRVVDPAGFASTADVLDYLFPGVMTLGMATVSRIAAREIARQHPHLAALPKCTVENWRAWGEAAVAVLGPTLIVEGPYTPAENALNEAWRLWTEEMEIFRID